MLQFHIVFKGETDSVSICRNNFSYMLAEHVRTLARNTNSGLPPVKHHPVFSAMHSVMQLLPQGPGPVLMNCTYQSSGCIAASGQPAKRSGATHLVGTSVYTSQCAHLDRRLHR